jgi:hypothetical protein
MVASRWGRRGLEAATGKQATRAWAWRAVAAVVANEREALATESVGGATGESERKLNRCGWTPIFIS